MYESFEMNGGLNVTYFEPEYIPRLIVVNTDLKLSEITGLNAVLRVVPCNLSYDMICQKF